MDKLLHEKLRKISYRETEVIVSFMNGIHKDLEILGYTTTLTLND